MYALSSIWVASGDENETRREPRDLLLGCVVDPRIADFGRFLVGDELCTWDLPRSRVGRFVGDDGTLSE